MAWVVGDWYLFHLRASPRNLCGASELLPVSSEIRHVVACRGSFALFWATLLLGTVAWCHLIESVADCEVFRGPKMRGFSPEISSLSLMLTVNVQIGG